MDQFFKNRVQMAAMGLASALAAYGLAQLAQAQILQDRGLLAAVTLIGIFSGTVLLTSGPISLRASAIGGAALAVLVTVLMQLYALRYTSMIDVTTFAWPFVASLVLATLPLPFWIAHQRGQWRNYDVLFTEAWSILLRAGIATLFTGLAWLLIYLFDLLLSLVGVTVISSLLGVEIVPYLLTGGLFGLGLAVVQELSDVIGPHLILRLLRLLLPLTLLVVVVFLLAVPLNGFSNLFSGWSVGLTMLTIVAVGASLIAAVVDQREDTASKSRFLQVSARILAGLLILVAGLGAFAIYLRVQDYGWTPSRIVSAIIAVLALGYGAFYAVASVRSGDWMARIRQANVYMALATVVLAAISLTPILNAERISTNSQMARDVAVMDIDSLRSWGVAGQEALASLTARSKEPGQEALAARLAGSENGAAATQSVDDLIAVLPVSPKGADVTQFLNGLDPYLLDTATRACRSDMPTGGKGCVMVVADFLPSQAGDEASLFFLTEGYLQVTPLAQTVDQPAPDWRMLNMALPTGAKAEAMIRQLQNTPPLLQPAPLWQLPLGDGQVMVFLPPPVY